MNGPVLVVCNEEVSQKVARACSEIDVDANVAISNYYVIKPVCICAARSRVDKYPRK